MAPVALHPDSSERSEHRSDVPVPRREMHERLDKRIDDHAHLWRQIAGSRPKGENGHILGRGLDRQHLQTPMRNIVAGEPGREIGQSEPVQDRIAQRVSVADRVPGLNIERSDAAIAVGDSPWKRSSIASEGKAIVIAQVPDAGRPAPPVQVGWRCTDERALRPDARPSEVDLIVGIAEPNHSRSSSEDSMSQKWDNTIS